MLFWGLRNAFFICFDSLDNFPKNDFYLTTPNKFEWRQSLRVRTGITCYNERDNLLLVCKCCNSRVTGFKRRMKIPTPSLRCKKIYALFTNILRFNILLAVSAM